MTTKAECTIEVDAPLSTVYNQWTQFEEFPSFMGGITSVTQTTDTALHWVAEIKGVRREWDATILEQIPDQKIAWAAVSGATNAGAVYFAPAGAGRTQIRLVLEYEPEGIVENIGDKLGVIERQAESDLAKFKTFIEAKGSESGGWREEVPGTLVGTPTTEDASLSEGDSGKAGTTTTAKVLGGALAAGAVAAAASVMTGSKEESTDSTYIPPVETTDTSYSATTVDLTDTYVPPATPTAIDETPYPEDGITSPLPSDTRSI